MRKRIAASGRLIVCELASWKIGIRLRRIGIVGKMVNKCVPERAKRTISSTIFDVISVLQHFSVVVHVLVAGAPPKRNQNQFTVLKTRSLTMLYG